MMAKAAGALAMFAGLVFTAPPSRKIWGRRSES